MKYCFTLPTLLCWITDSSISLVSISHILAFLYSRLSLDNKVRLPGLMLMYQKLWFVLCNSNKQQKSPVSSQWVSDNTQQHHHVTAVTYMCWRFSENRSMTCCLCTDRSMSLTSELKVVWCSLHSILLLLFIYDDNIIIMVIIIIMDAVVVMSWCGKGMDVVLFY